MHAIFPRALLINLLLAGSLVVAQTASVPADPSKATDTTTPSQMSTPQSPASTPSVTGPAAPAQPAATSSSSASSSQPTVKTMPQTKEVENIDALLAPPPQPKGKVSLFGGTVKDVDAIRNKMTLQVFGGNKTKVFFDERSHIYRNGVETTQLGIHKGDRVYVDTQLDKGRLFARNIQVQTGA